MIAPIVLVAQYRGTIDVSDTTRVDMRVSQPALVITESLPNNPPNPPQRKVLIAADLSTNPVARLGLRDARWDFGLSYTPSLTLPDVELGFNSEGRGADNPPFLAMHNVNSAFAWHNRFTRITIREAASYGELLDTLPATSVAAATPASTTQGGSQMGTAQAGPPSMAMSSTSLTQQLLVAKALAYGSSATTASLATQVGRRATLSVSGGFQVGGGLNSESWTQIGSERGPNASASFSFTFSRLDSLGVTASAEEIYTTVCAQLGNTGPPVLCQKYAPDGQLVATFSHRLSRTAGLSFTAGAAGYYDVTTTDEEEIVIQPVGTATLSGTFGPHGTRSFSLSVALAPYIDPITGSPRDRIQGTGNLSAPLPNRLALNVTAGVLESVPWPTADPNPLTSITCMAEVRRRLNPRLDVAIGAQVLWQSQIGYPSVGSEIGYISVSATSPTLRF
jgi:hypothetical protein